MKVLVVSSKYAPEYAGSGLRAHNTYKRLAKKFGVKFRVLAGSMTSNINRQYLLDGIAVKIIANKIFNMNNSPPKNSNFIRRIFHKICLVVNYYREALPVFLYLIRNQQDFEAIHVFGNVNITSAAISYAKLTKRPIVIELVNLVDNPQYQYEPKLISLLFGKGFPAQALIVCISEYLRNVCIKHGYRDRQVWCRPNPVDEKRFFYERDKKQIYRQKAGSYNKGDVIIFYLAKFIPRKKQDFMIEALSQLPNNYKLILAGPLVDSGPFLDRDTEFYRHISKIVHSAKLQDRVQLIPRFVENPQDYMKASDVFVIPAVKEAFGTPFLEALACGIPVVANDIPGVFDQWIKNGINGYICKLDPKEWAGKIIMAASIDDDKMKQASREVLKMASTEVIDREYYQRLSYLTTREG